jgi:hypothetical protein
MTTPTSVSAGSFLYIGSDPTRWELGNPEPVPPPWRDSSDPVALAVVRPLSGTLVLVPRRAGSIALLAAEFDYPWIPSQLLLPHIYVPTPAGVGVPTPGYSLAADTNLDKLEQAIMAAMRDGTPLDLAVTGLNGTGVLVLNGAMLPFVVLCPRTA